MNFGQVIRVARQQAGLSQKKLAKLSGMGENHGEGHVAGIEKGKLAAPRTKTIRKMAKVLNLDERRLILHAILEKWKKDDPEIAKILMEDPAKDWLYEEDYFLKGNTQ